MNDKILLGSLTESDLDEMRIWLGSTTGDFQDHQAIDELSPQELYNIVDKNCVEGVVGFMKNKENISLTSQECPPALSDIDSLKPTNVSEDSDIRPDPSL